MRLSVAFELSTAQTITGDMARSVFPLVEQWLEDTDHQKALAHVGNGRLPGRYTDKIDAVFCIAFPEWEAGCQAFYADKGPPLRDLVTQAELEIYQYALLRVLEVAYQAMCAKRRASWGWVTETASDPLVDLVRRIGPPPL